jgi:hypothetical protein
VRRFLAALALAALACTARAQLLDVFRDAQASGRDPSLAFRLDRLERQTTGWVNVKAPPFSAPNDGQSDDSAAVRAAIAALPANGGTVFFPASASNYRFNVTITRSNVHLRGAGRRSTTVQPYTNAPVVTLDATGGAIQGAEIADLGLIAGTSTSPAVTFTGSNINDWHQLRRLFFSGFTNTITIAGRSIWSRFIDGEIVNDLGRGVYVTGTDVVNHLLFQDWRVGASASDGLYFNCTGGSQGVYFTITLDHVNSENNGGHGVYAANVDAFAVVHSYIENNGAASAGISLGGTYARGLDIRGNNIWGQGHGVVDSATLTTGAIESNFFSNTSDNLSLTTTHADSHLLVGSNFEGGASPSRAVTVDVNGLSHFAGTNPLILEYNSETAAPSTATRKNVMRFTNGSPITVSNLTGADVGQLLYVWAAGAGTVRLVHQAGGAGQITFPATGDLVLASGSSVLLAYDTNGTTWRPVNAPTASRSRYALAWNATMYPDASAGELNVIPASSSAAVTIGAPVNQATNQKLGVQVRNTSGGALGTFTWNAVFKMSAWAAPANGNSRTIWFTYDGTNWVETARTTADVPN